MLLRRGDLVLVNLDPTVGFEIQKTRPAVIISNNAANEYSALVTILPITSKKVNKIYPFEILIEPKDAALGQKGKIKVDQIRAIDKMRLVKKLGKLKKDKLSAIERALILHLSINLDHFIL